MIRFIVWSFIYYCLFVVILVWGLSSFFFNFLCSRRLRIF